MSLSNRFNRTMDRLWAWFERQVGLVQGTPEGGTAGRFQPSRLTGAFVLAAFAYQFVSGGLLLLYYQPSVSSTFTLCGQTPGAPSSSPAAWCSTSYILHSVPLGSVLLTTHLYGAYVVIALTILHLFWGYYRGAYKRAGRELSWIGGVVLLVLVLGMGFTGYLLTYTQLSYNATQVSVTLMQSVPYIGPAIASLVVGDGTPQSLLTRMFAFHVVLLPLAIIVLVYLHKRMPLYPRVYLYLVKWGLLYVGVLVSVAYLWPWQLPTYAGNIGAPQPVTVPAWYFLWLFKLVDFVWVTPADAMIFTGVVLLFLVLLPFLDRSSHLSPRDRPVFLFLGNSLLGFFVLMTVWGDLTPGLPIQPAEVALRLGPVLAVNAVVVAFFYFRYRRAKVPSSAPAPPSSSPSPWSSPTEQPPPKPGAGSPSESGPVLPPKTAAPEPLLTPPVILSVAGLAGSFFLLAFGLWLPFVFLFAAFLVAIAEASRPSRAAANLLFALVGFFAVVVLLVALVLVVVV